MIKCDPSKVQTFRTYNGVMYINPSHTRYWWLGDTVREDCIREIARGDGCEITPAEVRSYKERGVITARIYHSLTR